MVRLRFCHAVCTRAAQCQFCSAPRQPHVIQKRKHQRLHARARIGGIQFRGRRRSLGARQVQHLPVRKQILVFQGKGHHKRVQTRSPLRSASHKEARSHRIEPQLPPALRTTRRSDRRTPQRHPHDGLGKFRHIRSFARTHHSLCSPRCHPVCPSRRCIQVHQRDRNPERTRRRRYRPSHEPAKTHDVFNSLVTHHALRGGKPLEVGVRKSPHSTRIPCQTLGRHWAKLHSSVTEHLRIDGAG